jgi:hypothetical protein
MKTNTSEETIENFVAILYEGVAAWQRAGKLLVALVDRNPDVKMKIVKEHPEISIGVLTRLEMVGRGFVKPEMLLSDAPAYRAARTLPISDQARLINNPSIPLVIREGGKTEVLHVDFRNLQAVQVRQVFASDHIRDESEQRAWIESQARPAMKTDWWIEDGMVVFRKGARFTVSQLSGVIQQVAERAAGSRRGRVA